MRIPKQLEPLHDIGLIDEVLRPLMSGKEAAAWIVRSEGEVRCAKVYKEAQSRSFKQRAAYTEGRRVRSSREARAMAKGSKYGRQQEELSWQSTEVDALYKLSAAGVRVPEPFVFEEGVLIMELLLDHTGAPAPRLCDVPLQAAHARAMLQYIAHQAARMLLAGIVHGDLSEYNVLIAWDGPVIIDLPQAIDASANRNAREVFIRDLDHLTQFLTRFAPDLAETEYGREIWNLYETGRLKADIELTGKGPKRSHKQIDGRRLAREVEEAAEAERPRDQERRRKRGGGGGPPPPGRDAQRSDGPPRNDRPRDERGPRPERPRDERPRDERPRDERPRDERPRDDRGPRPERPRDDRPRDDRGPRPERPRDERPRDERPRDDRGPRPERPRDERPRDERPRDDRSRADAGPRPERPERPGNPGNPAAAGDGGSPRPRRRRRRRSGGGGGGPGGGPGGGAST